MQIEIEIEPADQGELTNGDAFCLPGCDGRPTRPRHLSPSGASRFEQCPRSWRFRYVDRLPDPPGVAALVGTFAHRVLELLMQEVPGRRTKDAARRIARTTWLEISDSDEYKELGLNVDEALDFRWTAWRAIEGLWRLEDPAEVEVEATEEQVVATLGGVPFLGVVDRIERAPDGLVVSDYKSCRPPPARFAPDRLQQVLLYAAAVAEQSGEPAVRARLLYLGQKVLATAVTPAETKGAVARLADAWDAIGRACDLDHFEPRPGPLCRSCAYAEFCPEGQAETARRAALRAAEEESLMRLADACA